MKQLNLFGNVIELEMVEEISDLPLEHLHAFMEFQMGHGGCSLEDFTNNARDFMYLVGEIETSILKKAIESHDDYPDLFDDFLKEYLGDEEPVDYGNSIWPLILDEEEIISDGWHRFVSYTRKGYTRIPMLLVKEKRSFHRR